MRRWRDMAGSLNHVTTDNGKFLAAGCETTTTKPGDSLLPSYPVTRRAYGFHDMIENLGDAYEAIEEMFGIIILLAKGSAARVEAAKESYERGVAQGFDRGLRSAVSR